MKMVTFQIRILFILNLVQLRTCNITIPLDHETTNNDVIIKCLFKIVYSNFRDTPTIIHENGEDFYKKLIDITNEFNLPSIINKDRDVKSIYMLEGHILSVIYFSNCRELNEEALIKSNEEIKYLVVINSTVKCTQPLQEISQYVSKYDVTFLVLRTDQDYDVITFIPQMNAERCEIDFDVSPTYMGTCDSREKVIVFPNKDPQNLMGCPFKVGLASFFPFSTIKDENSLQLMDPIEDLRGSDIEILKIMSEYFNFTMNLHFILRREENPVYQMAFLNFLLNGSLDACAGGLYRIYGDVVEYSGVYSRQVVLWVYPAERSIRSWQNLIAKVNGLYIFFIFYLGYSMIWYLFCLLSGQTISISKIMMDGWGALIGTSSLQEARNLNQKIVNVFYLIMCLHLSSYVSIQIFSFLTIVGPPIIYKTNGDIYGSHLKPFLVPTSKYFLKDKFYESFANTSEDCISYKDCEEMCLKHNGITIVLDGHFTVFQAETAVNDEARALSVPENLLTVYHEMSIRKDVSITRMFQRTMTRLRDAGISDRLYHEAIGILVEAKAQTATKNIMSYSYNCESGCSITMSQSAGVFYLWAIGCAISFCCFVVEVMLNRKLNVNNVI